MTSIREGVEVFDVEDANGDIVEAVYLSQAERWFAEHDREAVSRRDYAEAALRRVEHDLREEFPRDQVLGFVRECLLDIERRLSDDSGPPRCVRCGNPHFINDMCSECGTHIGVTPEQMRAGEKQASQDHLPPNTGGSSRA